ncbi:MAG TPA: YgjP-like metallopeptidase domain-containing protein [Actinomycetes bacterium]
MDSRPVQGAIPFDLSAAGAPPQVEVRRSARRRRTVSAFRDGDRTIVLLPARMSRADEKHWVAVMVDRLDARDRRRRPSDVELLDRATMLSERYLGGRAVPAGVRWVGNQNGRWGSCTVDDRTIRLSTRLRGMPDFVVDYVLLHELVHLLVPGHGPAFWAELAAYPRTERARGYLDGWAAAAGSAQDGDGSAQDGDGSADEGDAAADEGAD